MKLSNLRYAIVLMSVLSLSAFAQDKSDSTSRNKIYVVIKNDGAEYVGKILSQDAREVLIETTTIGQLFIPKHEIREIRELKAGDLTPRGDFVSDELFSTRYFITTNGLPILKGDSYIQWNWYGPDFQFGIGKNTGMGVMTTWIGAPIVMSFKHSIKLNEGAHLGVGALVGTLSWAKPDFAMALPFASLTFGDRKSNITFSGGYGAFFSSEDSDGRALLSIAGMSKIGRKLSLVFDSFMLPANASSEGGALLIPGLRWQTDRSRAFQFGFAGFVADNELVPAFIPMVQWYRKFD
jgi:hypothetical protein